MLPGRTPLQTLIVDTEQRDAEFLAEQLQSAGFAVQWRRVDNEEDYNAALAADLDLVLCDYSLPRFDAMKAFSKLRARGFSTPFIVLSRQAGEEHAVESMRAGADDYVMKDRYARLPGAVSAALERKRLREAMQRSADQLKESREQLASFLENSPAIMFKTAMNGCYLHVNEAFTQAFNLKPEQVIGKRDEDIFPPDRATQFSSRCHARLCAGETVTEEHTVRLADGDHTYVVVRFPLHDAKGAIYGIGGIATDISDREKVEQRYRASFDQLAVGIAHTAIDGRYIAVNQKLCEMLGYTRQELLQRRFQDVSHPDGAAESDLLRDLLTADAGTAQSAEREKRYLRKDGTVLWANVALSTVRKPTGEVDYFVTMVQDISARKAADERFRATFEQVAVGLAHVSLDNRYLAVNQKLCDMTGYTRDEFLAMDAGEITHADDRDDNPDRARLLDGTLSSYSEEKRYLRKNGEIFWANRTVSIIRDAGEAPEYFVRVIEDITQRKWAEAHATLLQAVTRAMGEARDLDESLRITLQKICEATGWTFAQAWLPSADGRALECRVAWRTGPPMPEEFHRRRVRFQPPSNDSGLIVSAYQSKKPMWVADIASAANFKRGAAAAAHGFKAWVGIPVLVGDQSVALLEFYVTQPTEHDARHVAMVDAVATQLGLLFQHRAAEEALRESDERFRQLSENIPEVFWITDARQRHLYYLSRGFEKLTGRTNAAIMQHPRSWLECVHPDDRERVRRARREEAHLGTYDIEYRVVHTDGTIRWIQDHASVVRDESGAVCRIVGIGTDITERKDAENRVLRLAHYDPLTGLPNRVLFYDRLRHTLAQARRNTWTVAVLFIDLDRFKIVNDTLGHAAGDKLLLQVSERLTGSVRPGDTVARFGGDEFAVILTELAEPQDAGVVAQKLLDAITTPFLIGTDEVYTTSSMGISVYPIDSDDIDVLVRNADTAMYGAKSAGRNMYQFYTAAMNDRALERMQLENKLRHALAREEFQLHYQPKINIETRAIVGFEALLRWQPADRPLVQPDQFISLLEETGLIVPVGEWVLRAACRQVQAWLADSVLPVPIAVNLSARQLEHKDFSAMVTRTFDDLALEPRWIEAEITESALMNNPQHANVVLGRLKALGMRLSIDDFGTGYSSLSYLKRFPLDTLKIDRSFVRDITADTDDATITRSVITLAHSLGLTVIAEGVETEAQLAFLSDNGCNEAQGYLFSRPLPVDEATALLLSSRTLRATGPQA